MAHEFGVKIIVNTDVSSDKRSNLCCDMGLHLSEQQLGRPGVHRHDRQLLAAGDVSDIDYSHMARNK